MQNLLLPRALVQSLVDYLKVRPYQEVYGLIPGLLTAPVAEAPGSSVSSEPTAAPSPGPTEA